MFFRSVFSKLHANVSNYKRFFSGSSSTSTAGDLSHLPKSYSTGVQVMHWTMGGSMLACVGLVLSAQNTKDKKLKGNFMYYHKSFGLLAFGLLFPRLYLRLTSKAPGPIEGANELAKMGASLSHYILYGFIIGLPVTGVAMGAYSGFGLPFFFTVIPSISKNQQIAKPAYEYHKQMGQAFEYFVPLHVAGAVYHVVAGHSIAARIIGGAAAKSA